MRTRPSQKFTDVAFGKRDFHQVFHLYLNNMCPIDFQIRGRLHFFSVLPRPSILVNMTVLHLALFFPPSTCLFPFFPFPSASPSTDLLEITPNPLDIPEIRAHAFSFLPRSALMTLNLVSHDFYSTARVQLGTRINICAKDRVSLWAYFRASCKKDTSPRATMALIDLSLNPGEILATLMHCCTDNIRRAEFIASDQTIPEWSANMSDEILSTIVAYLPEVSHFVIYALSTRHQFGLMISGSSRITTLELHNSNHLSRRFELRRVTLPELISLHLIDATSYTSGQDFLCRVASWIVAPKLATLSLANCLCGNAFAVREVVRHFSRCLTKLILLDDFSPLDRTPITFPPLPHLQQLEIDILWAAMFLGPLGKGSSPDVPSLHTIVFQATPETVLGGLRDGICHWGVIWTALDVMQLRLKSIECCYRAHDCALQDSFRLCVQERLLSVALSNPLRGPWTIREGVRDPIPAPSKFDNDASTWGYDD